MPRVSVLIPVFNVEEYLQECLDSVSQQTFQDFEVILVNDGSTDSSPLICQNYASRDSRYSVINQENSGLASARNTALGSAVGEFVAFIDSDDFVDKDYLLKLLEICDTQGVDVAICGRWLFSDDICDRDSREAYASKPLNSEMALRALNSYSSFDMSMCSKLIRRSLFDDVAFPEGKLSEDQFVCFRVLDRANSAMYAPDPLYYYRQRPGSISRGNKVNVYPIEASDLQSAYFRVHHPELLPVAETSRFFSRVGVYNAHVKRGILLESSLGAEINKTTHRCLGSVLTNRDLPLLKKIQALLFCTCKSCYNKLYLSRRG